MSDQADSHQNPRSVASGRTPVTRPPIQWPVRSATATNTAREGATQLARQRLERVYTHEGEPNQEQPDNQAPQRPKQQPSSHHQAMRAESYDWQQYHTAWQQYYHQYFYRYYAGWWVQQKQQLEAQAGEELQESASESKKVLSERERARKELRDRVRASVKQQSEKVKSSNHFKPILAAVTVGSLFLLVNYNQVLVGAVKQYIAPGSVVTTPVIVEPSSANMVSADPKIIIPKIGVEAPVVYDEPKVDEASYQAALERGVVRLGTTADPGTKGNVVIGGHSSNNVFNAGKYKYVFVNLKRLDVGDIFYLNYGGKRYTYKITVAKKIIAPTDTSVLAQTEKPTVTLFTCDPPGTNVNRLIVQAEQIDPSPEAATANTKTETNVNKSNPLPSVAPSLWDRLFSW